MKATKSSVTQHGSCLNERFVSPPLDYSCCCLCFLLFVGCCLLFGLAESNADDDGKDQANHQPEQSDNHLRQIALPVFHFYVAAAAAAK
jgi:hypothetical protein